MNLSDELFDLLKQTLLGKYIKAGLTEEEAEERFVLKVKAKKGERVENRGRQYGKE